MFLKNVIKYLEIPNNLLLEFNCPDEVEKPVDPTHILLETPDNKKF